MSVFLYAGVLALFYIALSAYVIKGRMTHGVGLGHGGHDGLERRIRAHANFAEYVPFALLLLLMVELANAPVWGIHTLGLMLIIGRIFHAAAILGISKIRFGRQIGMSLTFSVLAISAFIIIWKYVTSY